MFWMFWRDELTMTAFTTASLRWLARLAWLQMPVAGGGGVHRGCSEARGNVRATPSGTAAACSRRLWWLVTRGASTSQLCAQETALRKVEWGEGENNLFTITF
jgi:hypothetical protein